MRRFNKRNPGKIWNANHPLLTHMPRAGERGGGEISPGGTLRGRQNHVSSSTGKYGIGLNIVKLRLFVKKFACGAIVDFLYVVSTVNVKTFCLRRNF